MNDKTPAAPPGEQPKAPAAKDDMAEFLGLVVGMSRFLFDLARIKPFRNTSLGLAEWAALSLLASAEPLDDKRLARTLGVTRDRLNHLKALLEDASLISKPQAKGGAVIVTKRGKLHLEDINALLKPLLRPVLKENPRTLAAATKQVKVLMQIIREARKESDADNQGRKIDGLPKPPHRA